MVHDPTRRDRVDHDLLRRYRQGGDLQAREELAERFMPLVRSIARRYAGRGQDQEDLVQVGLVGLAKAIERHDRERGHRFVSFAVPNIQGEIRRHFRDCTWAVHVPRRVQELDARAQRARVEHQRQTGREASTEDLATILEVSDEEVRDAQAAGRSYRALSLDQPAETDGPGPRSGALDPGFVGVEDVDLIRRAMVGLSARDRQVITWRFQDGLLQREIAERIGVSQMQVSRILASALGRMGAV